MYLRRIPQVCCSQQGHSNRGNLLVFVLGQEFPWIP